MSEKCVLFIDDDKEILQIYKTYAEGRRYRAVTCAEGADALLFLSENTADCIVLDVMMPETDGFALLPEIRKRSRAPVIFLSGRTADADRIRGLSLGADDYLNKPCSLKELMLRIGLNIRKNRQDTGVNALLEFPAFTLDPQGRKAYFKGEEILLSAQEYDLLYLFAKHAGETLLFETIGKAVFGAYLETDRPRVMMAVSRLRKRLGDADLIETVRGEGYRFTEGKA